MIILARREECLRVGEAIGPWRGCQIADDGFVGNCAGERGGVLCPTGPEQQT